jgi:hypothetical protein
MKQVSAQSQAMSLNMNASRHLDQSCLRQLPGLCREPRSRRDIEEFTDRTFMIELIERRFGTTTDFGDRR